MKLRMGRCYTYSGFRGLKTGKPKLLVREKMYTCNITAMENGKPVTYYMTDACTHTHPIPHPPLTNHL